MQNLFKDAQSRYIMRVSWSNNNIAPAYKRSWMKRTNSKIAFAQDTQTSWRNTLNHSQAYAKKFTLIISCQNHLLVKMVKYHKTTPHKTQDHRSFIEILCLMTLITTSVWLHRCSVLWSSIYSCRSKLFLYPEKLQNQSIFYGQL